MLKINNFYNFFFLDLFNDFSVNAIKKTNINEKIDFQKTFLLFLLCGFSRYFPLLFLRADTLADFSNSKYLKFYFFLKIFNIVEDIDYLYIFLCHCSLILFYWSLVKVLITDPGKVPHYWVNLTYFFLKNNLFCIF